MSDVSGNRNMVITIEDSKDWDLLSVLFFNVEKTARSSRILVKQIEKRMLARHGHMFRTKAQKKLSERIVKAKEKLYKKSEEMQRLAQEARASLPEAQKRGSLMLPVGSLHELKEKVQSLNKELIRNTREAAQNLRALEVIRRRQRRRKANTEGQVPT